MSGRPPSSRTNLALAAGTVTALSYLGASLVASLVPGLVRQHGLVVSAVVLGAGAAVAAWAGSGRLSAPDPIRRPPRLPRPPETERLARRLDFDRRLQQSLAAATDDGGIVDAVGRALAEIPPVTAGELLLWRHHPDAGAVRVGPGPGGAGADPGRSGGVGGRCPVEGPEGCPALRSGRMLRSEDPATPAACRHLTGRADVPARALCLPVVGPGFVGVLHRAESRPDRPMGDTEVGYLESVAVQVTERLTQGTVSGVAADPG